MQGGARAQRTSLWKGSESVTRKLGNSCAGKTRCACPKNYGLFLFLNALKIINAWFH